jgi:hypothetical protein
MMTEQEIEQFTEGLAGIYEFYRKPLSKFVVDVWVKAMRPFDLAAINDAFGRHLVNPDTGQFLPMPADIAKMLGGSSLDSAMVAWSKVDQAVRVVGIWQTVVFDDPLIHRVVADMGGWIKLNNATETDWPFIAKEFQNRYRAFRVRNEIPEFPAKLVGLAEAENSKARIAFEIVPVSIGNPERARKVLTKGGEPGATLKIGRLLPNVAKQISGAAGGQ